MLISIRENIDDSNLRGGQYKVNPLLSLHGEFDDVNYAKCFPLWPQTISRDVQGILFYMIPLQNAITLPIFYI